jgi:AbrB family looped-hinge helix DNA binding protein
MRTTIDGAGRVVIPKSMRQAMGLTGGQEIDVVFTDGRIEIELAPLDVRLERRDGVLVAVPEGPVPAMTTDEVRRLLEELRDERSGRVV